MSAIEGIQGMQSQVQRKALGRSTIGLCYARVHRSFSHAVDSVLPSLSAGLARWVNPICGPREPSTNGERLGELLENIPGMIMVQSGSGRIELANRQLLDCLGLNFAELNKMRWIDVIHPEDAGMAEDAWHRSLKNQTTMVSTVRLKRFDGKYRWFKIRSKPSKNRSGEVDRWYTLVFDIDRRKRMEQAVRTTQAQLSRVSRITALAAVSGSIAHEINQPLAAVVSNAHACQSWLLQTPPNLDRALVTMERILRHGRLAAGVVDRIRALFRNSPPAKESLDLNELIVEVVQLLESHCVSQQIAIDLDLACSLPKTSVDRIQMQQVLMNLLQNGFEATGPSSADRPALQIATHASGASVVIEVRDRGVGLQNPDQAFEPFFTTKDGGMGMGLAICRSIVESHNGKIRAMANEPYGTIFRIALPVLTPVASLEEFAPEEVSIC